VSRLVRFVEGPPGACRGAQRARYALYGDSSRPTRTAAPAAAQHHTATRPRQGDAPGRAALLRSIR
jgi:hypothetical protein